MDGFLLTALVKEISATLAQGNRGLPVGKIAATGRDTVTLDLGQRGRRWLVLAARPHDSRFYLTEHPPQGDNAVGEPPFVARLRKALRGARLVGLAKVPTERSVTLTLDGFNTAEQPTRWLLRHDLTGRYANLWLLTEDETVVDALRPWDGAPGDPYRSPTGPAARRLAWDAVTPDMLPETTAALAQFLLEHLQGCRPSVAREVAFRAQSGTVWAAFADVRAELLRPTAFFLYKKPEGWELSPVQLTHAPDTLVKTFPSAREAVAALFDHLERQTTQAAQLRQWRRAATTWRRRLERALHKLDQATAAAQNAEQWRRWGELLYANLATARRTPAGVEVVDYYAPEQPTILIPLPSAAEDLVAAAQHYFHRYQRAQRTLETNAARRATLVQDLATAIQLEQQAATAGNTEAPPNWLAELRTRLPFDLRPREPAATDSSRLREQNDWTGLRRYRGPAGYEIVVGRTAHDNDRLTFTLARPHDLWLHTADYPGAHVIIRNPQRNPIPPQVVLAAAELAAYFSQAKQAGRVDVRVAERRHVARPRRGAPGQALVRRSRTVTVTPREVLPRLA